MNDQLKKFVQDNREEFDHLEPAPHLFHKIKSELKADAEKPKSNIRFLITPLWLAAASIVIVLLVTFSLFKADPRKDATTAVSSKGNPEASQSIVTKPLLPDAVTKVLAHNPVRKSKPAVRKPESIAMDRIYLDLADSTSASTRLAAILSLQKSNLINYDIIHRLAETLNSDANSNVRLAALDIMSKYVADEVVSDVLSRSLAQQNDPAVQLGLIGLLHHVNNPKLDDQLFALANDPTTLALVKNQVYLVLLNQNKL